MQSTLRRTVRLFEFPVKVHLANAFVGEHCYVGSDENPIVVKFTTGESGSLIGKVGAIRGSTAGIIVDNDTLVSEPNESPGVEGCEIDDGADAAMDSTLGLPSATGNSAVLDGTLKQGFAPEDKAGLEEKA